MALSDASTLKSQPGCPSSCPPSAQSQIDTLHGHQVGSGSASWASALALRCSSCRTRPRPRRQRRCGSTWGLAPLACEGRSDASACSCAHLRCSPGCLPGGDRRLLGWSRTSGLGRCGQRRRGYGRLDDRQRGRGGCEHGP
jgi:hypothetical protein